jgi:hypothetical protein
MSSSVSTWANNGRELGTLEEQESVREEQYDAGSLAGAHAREQRHEPLCRTETGVIGQHRIVRSPKLSVTAAGPLRDRAATAPPRRLRGAPGCAR